MSRSGKSQTGHENARAASSSAPLSANGPFSSPTAAPAHRPRQWRQAPSTPRRSRTDAIDHSAPPARAIVSSAQASGYCSDRGGEIRPVPTPVSSAPSATRAGTARESWFPAPSSAAPSRASATRNPSPAMRRPSTLSSARWSTSAWKPPMRSRSVRRRHIVAPRQSCRPIARDSTAPGRKPLVICMAPSRPGQRARADANWARQTRIQRRDQSQRPAAPKRRPAGPGSPDGHAHRHPR